VRTGKFKGKPCSENYSINEKFDEIEDKISNLS
jgi:hypothetical protein